MIYNIPLCPGCQNAKQQPAHCRRTWPKGPRHARFRHVCGQPKHPYEARGSRHHPHAEPCAAYCGRITRGATHPPEPLPGTTQTELPPSTFTPDTRKGGGD